MKTHLFLLISILVLLLLSLILWSISDHRVVEVQWAKNAKSVYLDATQYRLKRIYTMQCCYFLVASRSDNGKTVWRQAIVGNSNYYVVDDRIIVQSSSTDKTDITVLNRSNGKKTGKISLPLIEHSRGVYGRGNMIMQVGYIDRQPHLIVVDLVAEKPVYLQKIYNHSEQFVFADKAAYYLDYDPDSLQLDQATEGAGRVFRINLEAPGMGELAVKTKLGTAANADYCLFHGAKIACLDLQKAQLVWVSSLEQQSQAQYHYVTAGDRIYVIQNAWEVLKEGVRSKHPTRGVLYAINAADGSIIWRYPMEEIGPMTMDDRYIVINSNRGVHVLERETGLRQWKFERNILGGFNCPVIWADTLWFGATNYLHVYDIRNGARIAAKAIKKFSNVCPKLLGDQIVVNGVMAVTLH